MIISGTLNRYNVLIEIMKRTQLFDQNRSDDRPTYGGEESPSSQRQNAS